VLEREGEAGKERKKLRLTLSIFLSARARGLGPSLNPRARRVRIKNFNGAAGLSDGMSVASGALRNERNK
jgi:hypothetical protein